MMQASCTILLHRVEGPINLGSVCRAMANFGFLDLRFSGALDINDPEARKFALHAERVLNGARRCAGLDDLLSGLDTAYAFSPRSPWNDGRDLALAELPRYVADDVAAGRKSGLLFGNEASGLANRELAPCHFRVALPTHADYPSMNLSHAVTVVLWELYRRLGNQPDTGHAEPEMATAEEIERVVANVRAFAEGLDLLNPQSPDHLWQELQPLLGTRRWTKRETDLLNVLFAKGRVRYEALARRLDQGRRTEAQATRTEGSADRARSSSKSST